jgi:hypothetical protein
MVVGKKTRCGAEAGEGIHLLGSAATALGPLDTKRIAGLYLITKGFKAPSFSIVQERHLAFSEI